MMINSRKIWRIYLLSLFALLLGGCDWHADPSLWDSVDKPWDGDLYLKLNIAVAESGNGISTRAMGQDDYFENPSLALDLEKLHSLRVIIVKHTEKDGVSLETVVHNLKKTLISPSYIYSDLMFKVDFSTTYRVYLIGNEDGLSGLLPNGFNLTTSLKEGTPYTSVNSLEKIILTAPADDSNDDESTDDDSADDNVTPLILFNNTNEQNTKPIPMTEVFTITTQPRPDTSAEYVLMTEERNFFITRAATKFSFIFKKAADFPTDIENIQINSVTITGLTPREFLLPNDTEYSPVKGQPSTNDYGGREITQFKVPTDANAPGNYTFTLSSPLIVNTLPSDGTPFDPQLYFPESKGNPTTAAPGTDEVESGDETEGDENVAANKKPFQCFISFANTDFEVAPVDLPNLDALPRNTHVKVIIMIKDHSIKAEVDLVPYTGCILDATFGKITSDNN